MKNNIKFDDLPSPLQIKTAQNLSTTDLKSLAISSKYNNGLFKPMADVRQFLHAVTCGEHKAVKEMLKKDTSLIFKRGSVTDCSGRSFDNISAFEYALWCLDKHMWTTMIGCIPHNEKRQFVFAKLLAQYNSVSRYGVTYKFNGAAITEQHFDFENTIFNTLQILLILLKTPGPKDWSALAKHWRENVGGAQKMLPMHVVDEYCSNKSFADIPEFTDKPESSKQFYNWTTKSDEYWFKSDSKLGIDFAIYKTNAIGYDQGIGCCGAWPNAVNLLELDLAALSALYKIRSEDFIILKSELEEHVDLNYLPKALLIGKPPI
jgi:hypothetical protein